jgi:NADP-dependent 3-hydroxy acid dehydrogenase YdfG
MIVQAFLEESVNVSFCARTVDGLEFSEFQSGSPSAKVIGTSVDISVSSQIKAWVEKAVHEMGPIDAVVANG